MYVVTRDIGKIIDCYNFLRNNISEFSPNEILCAFDIDNTITIVECKYSYWPNICKWKNELEIIKSKYKEVDSNIVYTNLLLEHQIRVFDNDIYNLFENFDCKKIMLTASLTGEFEKIKLLEEYRYNTLANFKISFIVSSKLLLQPTLE